MTLCLAFCATPACAASINGQISVPWPIGRAERPDNLLAPARRGDCGDRTASRASCSTRIQTRRKSTASMSRSLFRRRTTTTIFSSRNSTSTTPSVPCSSHRATSIRSASPPSASTPATAARTPATASADFSGTTKKTTPSCWRWNCATSSSKPASTSSHPQQGRFCRFAPSFGDGQPAGADLFVSLHFNTTQTGKNEVAGLETYCITPAGAASSNAQGEGADYGAITANRVEKKSLLFAYQIQKALVKILGVNDRSVRRARFAVLRDAQMPAILIEGGYMTNPAEGRRIYDAAWRRQMAAASSKEF